MWQLLKLKKRPTYGPYPPFLNKSWRKAYAYCHKCRSGYAPRLQSFWGPVLAKKNIQSPIKVQAYGVCSKKPRGKSRNRGGSY